MADCIPSTPGNPGIQLFNTSQTGYTLTPTSGGCTVIKYDLSPSVAVCRSTLSEDCSDIQVVPASTTATTPGALVPSGPSTQGPVFGPNSGGNPQQVSPPTNAPAPAPAPAPSSSSKISTGAIIGAAVGGVAVVVVALALLVAYRRKSRQRRGAAGGRKRLGSGLNVFEDGEEGGEEEKRRQELQRRQQQQQQQNQGREMSEETLVQVQDRSLGGGGGGGGGGPGFHIPPMPAASPLFRATPTAYPTAAVGPSSSVSQQAPMTTATASSFGRNVSPPPLNTIDYKPRSTYQPPVQHHAASANNNNNNKDEGGHSDYIDLIPVEDTPQISHAALPTGPALDSRGKGKARAMDIEEEYEDPEAERRGLLILGGSDGDGTPHPHPQQQQQQQQQQHSQPHQPSVGGRPISVTAEEDDEEINEEEIKYL
ncbi:hypothetical protein EMPS_08786 [Entomortierella parvispora]|uniref:Mid2 domain-containing protein n=1 Tax=Entomortierella parvispora TaxID=205924 RepID=A0A9P3HHI1_9FUNG|nr:hypothetical protein EMPS_08786 [Entomortierella parvispora]